MADSSVATSGSKKKKKNVFKTLGKGLSYKKKKQRPDDESVVAVALDRGGGGRTAAAATGGAPRSVAFADQSKPNGGGPSSAIPAKPIQVVLLLMDPSSRRFELLQLEFDSNKALVSDVLRQIQSSATEKTLRDMNYTGVCDRDGMEMISSMKLSRFCKGNDVVMATPNGMSGNETAKLASPILGDPKVGDMVSYVYLCSCKNKYYCSSISLHILYYEQLSPCGIQVQPQTAKKGRSGTAKNAEKENRRKGKKSRNKVKDAGEATKTSSLPTIILGIIIFSLLFFTVQRHVRVTSPLESGSVLLPGQWKSQCGIFDLFPDEWLDKIPMEKLSSRCDSTKSSMLELGKDGILRYFTKSGKDGELKEMWKVVGGTDSGECLDGEEDAQCSDRGATFMKDGNYWYVEIGGTRSALSKDVIKDFTAED